MVCSLVWQLMPSTLWPEALVAVSASGAARGTGTPSGPAGPGDGADLSVPSVLRLASFSPGEPVLAPPLIPSVTPTAAAAPTPTAPVPARHPPPPRPPPPTPPTRAPPPLASPPLLFPLP